MNKCFKKWITVIKKYKTYQFNFVFPMALLLKLLCLPSINDIIGVETQVSFYNSFGPINYLYILLYLF